VRTHPRGNRRRRTAEPTGRRRLGTRHLVAAVIAVIIVCGAAYAIVVIRNYSESKAPVAAADGFLNSLEVNGVDDAYNQLCPATRKDYTETQFAAYVKKQPGIDDHHSTKVELSTVDGVDSAVVTENLSESGGSTESHAIVLDKISGDWLVCGQPY
jgi:hypothetical protein